MELENPANKILVISDEIYLSHHNQTNITITANDILDYVVIFEGVLLNNTQISREDLVVKILKAVKDIYFFFFLKSGCVTINKLIFLVVLMSTVNTIES